MPDTLTVNSDAELRSELLRLKRRALNGVYPYADVWVYDESGEHNITDDVFKKLKINVVIQ